VIQVVPVYKKIVYNVLNQSKNSFVERMLIEGIEEHKFHPIGMAWQRLQYVFWHLYMRLLVLRKYLKLFK
jgi:hypothetical protein